MTQAYWCLDVITDDLIYNPAVHVQYNLNVTSIYRYNFEIQII